MLKSVVGFVREAPIAVVVVLLGVIAGGAVLGPIYVATLKERIQTKDGELRTCLRDRAEDRACDSANDCDDLKKRLVEQNEQVSKLIDQLGDRSPSTVVEDCQPSLRILEMNARAHGKPLVYRFYISTESVQIATWIEKGNQRALQGYALSGSFRDSVIKLSWTNPHLEGDLAWKFFDEEFQVTERDGQTFVRSLGGTNAQGKQVVAWPQPVEARWVAP